MKETPMMSQYMSFKNQYPDKILLFRMGDFYETFGEDAKSVSKILNITLTSRDKKTDPTPLAGFPHHALDQYLPKIIQSGNSAVVVDQLEDPKFAKGVVKRGVSRIVTPGTLDGELASKEKNSYLLSLYNHKGVLGIAYIDLSTGELKVGEQPFDQVRVSKVVNSLDPSEILLSEDESQIVLNDRYVTMVNVGSAKKSGFEKKILDFYKVRSIETLGLEGYIAAQIALLMIVEYVEDTQRAVPDHVNRPQLTSFDNYMTLDSSTIRNLDLTRNSYTGGREESLISVLDATKTASGKRKLHQWVLNPLLSLEEIEKRQNIVGKFIDKVELLEQTSEILSNTSDIERIIGKIGMNRSGGRDLRALSDSLKQLSVLKELMNKDMAKEFTALFPNVNSVEEIEKSITAIVKTIDEKIIDDPPISLSEGGYIKQGIDSDLDELRALSGDSKEWVKKLQAEEREKYGIPSLKVGFNRVFGYYLEVTKIHSAKVPEHYVRKQTLVNSERYITEDLKNKEDIILNAQEKITKIEMEIFQKLRSELLQYLPDIRVFADLVAQIDVLHGFASNAVHYSYVKPTVHPIGEADQVVNIQKGRHPVIERVITEQFIPNDTLISGEKDRMVIITGPNMAGKSTYIRQVALIVLMSQIGSYVPAESAEISMVDRIFSRVGASDNLAQGRSTFMVEMEEAANILNNATENSLIILDEVGRGTSTYDGVSIAWSLVEYLVKVIKARTLFATHYHELINLEGEHPEVVSNYNVEVLEKGDEVIFLRNIIKGGTDKSYGIYVAQMAGIPTDVIERANDILKSLDIDIDTANLSEDSNQKRIELQYSFFGGDETNSKAITDEIRNLDLDSMTPLEAFQILSELRKKLNSES